MDTRICLVLEQVVSICALLCLCWCEQPGFTTGTHSLNLTSSCNVKLSLAQYTEQFKHGVTPRELLPLPKLYGHILHMDGG